MTVNSLSDNPWFDLELSRHFKPHEACWGFDLDRDGAVEPSECADRDGDVAVDAGELQQFLDRHRASIVPASPFFKQYYEAGAAFNPGNPIHAVLSVESRVASPLAVAHAYRFTAKLLADVKSSLEGQAAATPQEKLRTVYTLLRARGIRLEESDRPLLASDLLKKQLDCDTSSWIVMAVAHEMNWPVRMVRAPQHVFVRWDDGEGERFNMDGGEIFDDDFYRREYRIPSEAAARGPYLKRLDRDGVFGTALFTLGVELYAAERFEEAVEYFNGAIEHNPRDGEAFNNRGVCRLSLEQYAAAAADLDQAIDIAGGSALRYACRGFARFKLGRYEEAIGDLSLAIALDPTDAWSYRYRGEANLALGRREEGLRDMKKVLELKGITAP